MERRSKRLLKGGENAEMARNLAVFSPGRAFIERRLPQQLCWL